ncbi:hypothetical protein BDW66DRAFT_76494 [Aspergillus desertorum]
MKDYFFHWYGNQSAVSLTISLHRLAQASGLEGQHSQEITIVGHHLQPLLDVDKAWSWSAYHVFPILQLPWSSVSELRCVTLLSCHLIRRRPLQDFGVSRPGGGLIPYVAGDEFVDGCTNRHPVSIRTNRCCLVLCPCGSMKSLGVLTSPVQNASSTAASDKAKAEGCAFPLISRVCCILSTWNKQLHQCRQILRFSKGRFELRASQWQNESTRNDVMMG